MSRYPPPPGTGPSSSSSSSYRPTYGPPSQPPPPLPWNGTAGDRYIPDQRSEYDFRGPRPDTHRPAYEPRDSRQDYRPPQSDFNFHVERPAGVQESYSSYRPPSRNDHDRDRRPRGPPDSYRSQPRNERPGFASDNRQNRGGYQGQNPRRGGGYVRRPPPKASDRPMLHRKHDQNVEDLLGDTTGKVTYRAIEDLTDSDDAAMEISGESSPDAPEPANKRARLTATTSNGDDQDVPKWSNPDPYTALPPPDETQRKKKDVVQLIRKARVEAESKKPAVSTEAADFISFDFSDDEGENGANEESEKASTNGPSVANAPTGPRTIPPHQLGTIALPQKQDQKSAKQNKKRTDLVPSNSLGSRKRTIDDQIKRPHTKLKKASKMKADGTIDIAWRVHPDEDPCPWVVADDHSSEPNMAVRLHKELADFHAYVRPRDFEERVRREMVDKLNVLVKRKWHTAVVKPFGSFMSGLYLPTADMDLVICSSEVLRGGQPIYHTTRHLYALKSHLQNNRVAFMNDIEAVTRAKVPLLKYCDESTGLRVDISFENLTGPTAIKTFLDWKKKYPAMPALVAIIKHYLCMRGLNEPVNGGIGGFSVICMVVHLFHARPEIQSRSMIPEWHMGELLMEFFNYYGNCFNYEDTAICMDPPRAVPKGQVSELVYRNMDRLSIIDPNNPANDISGGSSNFSSIVWYFQQAYKTLTERMAELSAEDQGKPNKDTECAGYNTILATLFAGNYSSFQKQRNWLKHLSESGPPNLEDNRDLPDRVTW